MKKFRFLLSLLICIVSHTVTAQDTRILVERADSLYEAGADSAAYVIYQQALKEVQGTDTIFRRLVWNAASCGAGLEKNARMAENYTRATALANENMAIIKRYTHIFPDNFPFRQAYMIKNLLVSANGLGDTVEAKKYRDWLYIAAKANKLPEGLDKYYNFDFFVADNKNVWGYEWFAELPKDRMSTSFTKIVYYVYSRKEDGSDDKQLYRLHLLMFHKIEDKAPDYILTRYEDVNGNEMRRSLYKYMYYENFSYPQLRKDIREVVLGSK